MLRGKHYQGYYNKRLRFRKCVEDFLDKFFKVQKAIVSRYGRLGRVSILKKNHYNKCGYEINKKFRVRKQFIIKIPYTHNTNF